MTSRGVLEAFDRFLAARWLIPDAVVIGGMVLEAQDGNAEWPEHVRATMADLAGRLGHAV